MIGIYPSNNITFEVEGKFDSDQLVEGKLYADDSGRLFLYSLNHKRANPDTGYFPIWDGKNKYITQFSNEKYIDKDIIPSDINKLSSTITDNIANSILYKQRISKNTEFLEPKLSDGDNMFTQCIKSIITAKQITLCDLIDITNHALSDKAVINYYTSLNKITFMRYDKWCIWLNVILHLHYIFDVYDNDKKLLSYEYPKNVFDTKNIKYDSIINLNDDPFKNIVKILLIMKNIDKNVLKSKEVDDYTINNLFTTLNGKTPLSAQLFDRFIRISELSYLITLYEKDGKEIFKYSKK